MNINLNLTMCDYHSKCLHGDYSNIVKTVDNCNNCHMHIRQGGPKPPTTIPVSEIKYHDRGYAFAASVFGYNAEKQGANESDLFYRLKRRNL